MLVFDMCEAEFETEELSRNDRRMELPRGCEPRLGLRLLTVAESEAERRLVRR